MESHVSLGFFRHGWCVLEPVTDPPMKSCRSPGSRSKVMMNRQAVMMNVMVVVVFVVVQVPLATSFGPLRS